MSLCPPFHGPHRDMAVMLTTLSPTLRILSLWYSQHNSKVQSLLWDSRQSLNCNPCNIKQWVTYFQEWLGIDIIIPKAGSEDSKEMLDQNKTRTHPDRLALTLHIWCKRLRWLFCLLFCVCFWDTVFVVPAVLELVGQAGLELTDIQVTFVWFYVYFDRLWSQESKSGSQLAHSGHLVGDKHLYFLSHSGDLLDSLSIEKPASLITLIDRKAEIPGIFIYTERCT